MKNLFLMIAIFMGLGTFVKAQDQLVLNDYYYGKYKYKVNDDSSTDDEMSSFSTTYFEIVFTDSGTFDYYYSSEQGTGTYEQENGRLFLTLTSIGSEEVTFVREGDTLHYNSADRWEEEGDYYVFKGENGGPNTNLVGAIHGEYIAEIKGKKLKLIKVTSNGEAVLSLKQ